MYKGIIFNLIVEITAMVIIIFITIPIWNGFEVNEMQEVANYYDNYYYIDYEVIDTKDGKLVTLFNNSNTIEDYNLIMVVDEKEYKNVNDLKIYVNKEEKNVNNFEIINKNNKLYIIIDSGSLIANEKIYNINTNSNNNIYNMIVVEKL